MKTRKEIEDVEFLINRMMNEHKKRGHKDITSKVVPDWCGYCVALLDLKYRLKKRDEVNVYS